MPDANSSLLLPPMALAISSIRHRQSTLTITITIDRNGSAMVITTHAIDGGVCST
ncbi:GM16317 [Drosophila sechellia]|uniref:GM16317 n=1 Tax=Drosophila sechellia TaxID=7238 RepID=B4IGW9_DROSE|nr:GM16317 [Drosophila sechellia]